MSTLARGALLVAGTSSGAGKTTLVTGLCRCLVRRKVNVAPFKAQNMSLNSFVTSNSEEIARAQALQARAARVEPEAAMNPVLLKPGGDSTSQVIVLGKPLEETRAQEHWSAKRTNELLDIVVEAHMELRRRFDVVVCEGAGSAGEMNLRHTDIVNLGLAREIDAPTVVVGDIDRGGVFASFVGTMALLSPEDQRLVRGFVVNRFRGDKALLEPGLETLQKMTARPVLGVLPYMEGLGLDTEDAPDPSAYLDPSPPVGQDVLRVGVVRLPRASNLTDLDPLLAEPGVVVRFLSHPQEVPDHDLVVIPGTRATVTDLAWLRSRGIASALVERAARGGPILGICGGYQMLGSTIEDSVESRAGTAHGLGLLPITTRFATDKVLDRPRRSMPDGSFVEGYEIHHGVVTRADAGPVDADCRPLVADEGLRRGSVAGTVWHGLFENDAFRRAYLTEVAYLSGRSFSVSPGTCFSDRREALIDAVADVVEEHVDVEALLELLEERSKRRTGRLPVLSLT